MSRVIINEVGPRDGLQSQKTALDLSQRRALVEALLDAGLRHIEIGSFVSPLAVPQMAGTGALAAALGLPTQGPGAELSALVPNLTGFDLARAAGVSTVAAVVSATETMNRRNINMSLEEAFAAAREIIAQGRRESVPVHVYLAVAFECPYEGRVDPGVVRERTRQLFDAGAELVVVGDTIGAADPASVAALMRSLVSEHGRHRVACHFHDTRALGLANVYAALDAGVVRFDAAIGGIGGCPFAPGARGNVATEDVVMLCEQLGVATGVDMPRLLAAVDLISDLLGAPQGGRAHAWLRRSIDQANVA